MNVDWSRALACALTMALCCFRAASGEKVVFRDELTGCGMWRLAECFDEMAFEFKPHLDEAMKAHRPTRRVDTRQLARYIVTVIEGAIMLSRTHGESDLVHGQLRMLKEHLKQSVER